MTEILLSCENLCVGYKKELIKPFSFELHAGEVIALMGENGCGKSTLLKTIFGIHDYLKGQIELLGKNIKTWNFRERSKKMAIVSMSLPILNRITVREFVSLGRMPYSRLFDARTLKDNLIIDKAMILLNIKEFENRLVYELSDGERSRVFLARAIAQESSILLLDEPNAFLDIPRSLSLFRLLKDLAKKFQKGIIFSTHSIEYAEKYSDKIMVINKGNVFIKPSNEARLQGLFKWTEI